MSSSAGLDGLLVSNLLFMAADANTDHVVTRDELKALAAVFIMGGRDTMGINSWSRENVHVLTSIDYTKMSAEDRALESYPRPDHDYGLSWIRREGQGRVFYEAHGHSERVYAVRPMLEHLFAGIQYAIGDLKADDTPSRPASRQGSHDHLPAGRPNSRRMLELARVEIEPACRSPCHVRITEGR